MRRTFTAILSLAGAAFIGTAAVAQETCEAPKYSSQLAEASLTAQADVRLAAIKALADRAALHLGPNATGNVRLEGRYAVSAASHLAQGAYADTATSYFCQLRRRYANDPAKLAIVRQQERAFGGAIRRYFDFSVWQPGAESHALRERISRELEEGADGPPLLSRAEVGAALPNYTFDMTRIRQISAEGSIAQFANLGVCAGWVNRSIRRIEPSVLANLESMRTTIIDWLSGEQIDARIDIWDFVSQHMNDQLTKAAAPETVPNVSPQFMTCLRAAERQIAPQGSEAAAAASGAPATGGYSAPPAGPGTTPSAGAGVGAGATASPIPGNRGGS